MFLKKRYVVIDYMNQNLCFVGDSLQELREWLLISAEEDEDYKAIEEIKRLPLNENKFYNFLKEGYLYTLEWQNEEEYVVDDDD